MIYNSGLIYAVEQLSAIQWQLNYYAMDFDSTHGVLCLLWILHH
jgi:hypothetical protein